jgi:hypothetical protein
MTSRKRQNVHQRMADFVDDLIAKRELTVYRYYSDDVEEGLIHLAGVVTGQYNNKDKTQ